MKNQAGKIFRGVASTRGGSAPPIFWKVISKLTFLKSNRTPTPLLEMRPEDSGDISTISYVTASFPGVFL
jgi:hypothetical protein